jgi:hypothetical protein
MSSNADKARKQEKVDAVIARLSDIHENHVEILIGLLDENKLDQLILALGIGRVTLHEDQE